MTSQAFHILPDNPRSGAVSWQCSYHIKALKTIRGSLEAAFELKKVFRCSSYGFKIIEKKSSTLLKKRKSFQQVKGYIAKISAIALSYPHPSPAPIVIDDSSWKNAAESFTIPLTLTIGGVRKCNSTIQQAQVKSISQSINQSVFQGKIQTVQFRNINIFYFNMIYIWNLW